MELKIGLLSFIFYLNLKVDEIIFKVKIGFDNYHPLFG
jgi:hypothetical protein